MLRLKSYEPRHQTLSGLARDLTEDARPRIRIAVYDQDHRLVAESAPMRQPTGIPGAIVALMGFQPMRIPFPNGLVVMNIDVNHLEGTLRDYWRLMLPVGAVAIAIAWGAGRLIAGTAVSPLTRISAAMHRFADGDFRPEPIRSTRTDEIGELAHSFNGALHQVHSALAQRDRTEAEIRQFIADAGHELRTPLTVIMGYLDVLEDGAVDAPSVRQRVFATLRHESRRMRSLIEKLIYLARLEREVPSTREIVDVGSVVARVVTSLEASNGATAIDISRVAHVRVVADDTDIGEAIRNLLDNAIKYAPGALVTVGTEIGEHDVVLTVRDRGPGISEQDQVHVFDRFYRGRTGRDVEGSGLGLAIVRRAIQRSNGTIALESRPGEGTQFTIRLPLASVSSS